MRIRWKPVKLMAGALIGAVLLIGVGYLFVEKIDLFSKEPEENKEIYATSHTFQEEEWKESVSENGITELQEALTIDDKEAVTQDIVHLKDVYVEHEATVIMKCFYPDAISYVWETYNLQSREWKPLEEQIAMDELYRRISVCYVECTRDIAPVTVRCTVTTQSQVYEEICTINLLGKEIKEIVVKDTDVNAGEYMNVKDLPVEVKYVDDSTETVTGLYGLFWIHETKNSEYSQTISGNQMETITTIITENEYRLNNLGEEIVEIHYRSENTEIDLNAKLTGKDMTAPDIISLQLGDWQVNSKDEPVVIPVSVIAADNHTIYTELEYCFLPPGEIPQEDDWKKESKWQINATQNGIWTLYVRDKEGNISTQERELLIIDELPPDLTVRLDNTDWCKSVTIIAEATDKQDIEYFFSCKDTGEESGWISDTCWKTSTNGKWVVAARDRVGNIVEKEIVVSNIDNEVPVIHAITVTEVSGGGV